MTRSRKLVIGASGFLGSHVTRRLVHEGADVRVMVRPTSSTRAIDDLGVERHYGDIHDEAALRRAMSGCDVIYYCVVDARMWLRDPAPLFRTNVEGLRHVLDAAVAAGPDKFVFTSTTGTLAVSNDRPVTEADPHNWDGGGPYISARIAAEDLVLRYARERSLPAVAMCISTTYGPGDWAPTPHGSVIARIAAGRFPFYFGFSQEVVGIQDAERDVLRAGEIRRGCQHAIQDRLQLELGHEASPDVQQPGEAIGAECGMSGIHAAYSAGTTITGAGLRNIVASIISGP